MRVITEVSSFQVYYGWLWYMKSMRLWIIPKKTALGKTKSKAAGTIVTRPKGLSSASLQTVWFSYDRIKLLVETKSISPTIE